MSKSKAFEEFGKLLIERVRDPEVKSWAQTIKGTKLPQFWEEFEPALASLNEEQRRVLEELGTSYVDGVLHDLLFLLETTDWIKVRLETENEVVEDIRRVAGGDLQGYIFLWAEKYGKEPLSHKPPDSQ